MNNIFRHRYNSRKSYLHRIYEISKSITIYNIYLKHIIQFNSLIFYIPMHLAYIIIKQISFIYLLIIKIIIIFYICIIWPIYLIFKKTHAPNRSNLNLFLFFIVFVCKEHLEENDCGPKNGRTAPGDRYERSTQNGCR